ncbi:alpha/beta fold hydrolase [Nocardioides daejeonensis]|uniref:alpha/beta fold hydrolase n=1 Tax=Nocardioides daejeonensis TaxID=1046556 RepID=UPI000D744737|nr:alpha/beta hydrolase [Nocardioides daejeonensis]
MSGQPSPGAVTGSGFDGFELTQVDVGATSLRVRIGGSGPPLVLLHGFPQTHLMWKPVAADLARDFTVIAPDLRGYGGSGQPPSEAGHDGYSKRAMALDVVTLAHHLGHRRFGLVGHDRGARVAYRTALDHPDAVERLAVLDIVPTSDMYARMDAEMALRIWNWTFLPQRAPLPESWIDADPLAFLERVGAVNPTYVDAEARADYLAAVSNPAVVHAMCEDYRAGAAVDWPLDAADHGSRTITCPTLALWAEHGAVSRWFDVLATWRMWAEDLQGRELAGCGHFFPEEKPAETVTALREFFGAATTT